MQLEEIRELIELMRENEIAEIHVKQGDGREVSLVAAKPPEQTIIAAAPAQAIALPPPAGAPGASVEPEPEPEPEGDTINSPIVGTYYRAPSPESPAYIDVGDSFDDETVLCIVEAMKVMNEIKAETKGKILEILVENGQPVEFGQPLYRVQLQD